MRDRVKKEFIIGHPALMLATFAFMRKWPTVIHFLLTLAGVIGIASMVETSVILERQCSCPSCVVMMVC